MKVFRHSLSIFLALCLVLALPVQALAAEVIYDLNNGDILVHAGTDKQTVSQNSSSTDHSYEDTIVITSNKTETQSKVSISSSDGATAEVTFKDVNISSTDQRSAAVEVTGSAEITLEGDNQVHGFRAGVEVGSGSELTITGESTGSLKATSIIGAGIGGNSMDHEDNDSGTINIAGGQITAVGGDGAGIGGGDGGSGEVNISGGTVKAFGFSSSAGIGGGSGGGAKVNITGGNVEAIGGMSEYNGDTYYMYGPGIGSGSQASEGPEISISGGTVKATGGQYAAGIGGGAGSDGGSIRISGGSVEATGGTGAAGIGGGDKGNGSDVRITGGEINATGGSGGADIGGGKNSDSDGTLTIYDATVNGVYYPPKPESSASQAEDDGGDDRERDTFWDTIGWQVSQAEEGSTFPIEAGNRTLIPVYVVQRAQSRNITLVVKWNGGEDITIAPDAEIDTTRWCLYFKDL